MFSPRIILSTRTIKLTTVLSALVFAAGTAAALGLGDMVVHSRLGQALRAEIRLIETSGKGRPGETCFRLGTGEGNEALPVLTQGRLRVEQTGGQSRLLITSLQTISEPALMINVHLGCGAEVVRSYTLLIDPGEPGGPVAGPQDSMAEYAVGAERTASSEESQSPVASSMAMSDEYPATWDIVEGESAKSITKALFPRQPRAQRRFINALRSANPQVDFGADGEAPLAAGVSLDIPDTRRAPVAKKTATTAVEADSPRAPKKKQDTAPTPTFEGKTSDRLLISGDAVAEMEAGGLGDASDLGLRLSSDLSIRLSDTVSENARAMLRVEYKLLNALMFQAEKQLELAEQIRNLEARFEEMRVANEGAMRTADEVVAASKAEQSVAIEPSQKKPAVNVASPAMKAAPAEIRVTDGMKWWQPILLMLVLAGALTWWLARRHRAGEVADALQEVDSELSKTAPVTLPGGIPAKTDPWEAAEATAISAAALSASRPDILIDVSQPLPFRKEDSPRTVSPAAAIEVSQVGETDDSNTVLELAEIMVSFGRIKGAAQALAEYLESNPDTSLFPWLKLLEIYRMNDMREEFGSCSAQLRSHFNVAPASWEEAGECLGERIEPLNENDLSIEDLLHKLPTVGAFPHIREGISKGWDTSEGLAYLKHLLRDTRNGQRTGFPLSIARELLFLLDLQESRLRIKA